MEFKATLYAMVYINACCLYIVGSTSNKELIPISMTKPR